MAPFTSPSTSQPRCPRDVFLLAETEPAVARHLAAWTSGAFASFEDMLVSLVVELAQTRAEYRDRISRFVLTLGR